MEKPTTTEIQPHPHYMRPLDGIRGMACLFVVLAHITGLLEIPGRQVSGFLGSFGVIIFFVLSGFLMSVLYSHKAFGFNDAAKYAIARFTRIAPAYWIAVLFAWVLYMMIPDFHYQMTPWNLTRSVFFAGNQGVFWSIPPEVQFYGFFLLLWWACAAWREGRKIWLGIMIALCAVFVATRAEWGGLMLPSKLHIFLCGFGAAFLPRLSWIRKYIHLVPVQIGLTLAVAGYCILFVTAGTLYDDLVLPILVGLWVLSMSASTRFTTPFETNTMALMGAASFSIYLFHDSILLAMKDLGWLMPGSTLFNAAILSLISLAIPVAFHFVVEKGLNMWSKAKMLSYLAALQEKYPRLKR